MKLLTTTYKHNPLPRNAGLHPAKHHVASDRAAHRASLPSLRRLRLGCLKVAHVLEGSVQRVVNRVRVNAQLIDSRTDTHLWAQTYDRDLADVFAIQSEIAKTIADHLQAKLSPKEEAALQAKPTKDLVAYDLYLRATEIERNNVTSIGIGGNEEIKREMPLFEEAIQRDPTFVAALCALAHVRLYLYWQGADQTETNFSAVKQAIEAAARIQPDAGEVHSVRGELYYRGSRDYESALAQTRDMTYTPE